MSTQRSIAGRAGVMSVLKSFVLGTSNIFNLSLVSNSESFKGAIFFFGIIKPFGGFYIQIKIIILLFDVGILTLKCTF